MCRMKLDSPVAAKIKGARTHTRINGHFYHLNSEEAFGFIQLVQVKLADWGEACLNGNITQTCLRAQQYTIS